MDRYQNRYQRGYDRDYDRTYRRGGFDPDRDRFERPYSSYGRGDYDRGRYERHDSQREGRYRGPDYDRFGPIRYDQDYPFAARYPGKSQWQRDHGDPFGDRQRGTPMRVIRGDPEWDEHPRGRGRRNPDYERDYRSYRLDYGRDFRRDYRAWGFPQEYEPYAPEAGYHID